MKTKNKSAIQPWETSLQKLTRHGKKLFAITSSGPYISLHTLVKRDQLVTLFLRVTNKAIKPKIPFNGGMIMSNINNCCQDTTEIRLTVDQFIVLIFKLHESKLHLNGFNRIALESLAKELQRKLFKAIHLRYEWFRPVEAKLLNESFKSDTNKVTKETATFTIPTLLKATNGIRLDENIPAFK